MEDERIVDLYFSRSEDAIAESEEKYGAYCRSIAHRILRSDADAQECVNDTWMRAWNSIPPTRPESLRLYLGIITRNLSVNRLEKRNAKRRHPEEGCDEEFCDECTAGESDPERRLLLREGVNAFLGSLKKETRIVFIKRYWYCCSIEEIAAETSLSVSNVKIILHRTRKLFSDFIKKEGYPV